MWPASKVLLLQSAVLWALLLILSGVFKTRWLRVLALGVGVLFCLGVVVPGIFELLQTGNLRFSRRSPPYSFAGGSVVLLICAAFFGFVLERFHRPAMREAAFGAAFGVAMYGAAYWLWIKDAS